MSPRRLALLTSALFASCVPAAAAHAAPPVALKVTPAAPAKSLRVQIAGPSRANVTLAAAVKDGKRWLKSRRLKHAVRLHHSGRATVKVGAATARKTKGACRRGRLFLTVTGKLGSRRLSGKRNVQPVVCSPRDGGGSPAPVPSPPVPSPPAGSDGGNGSPSPISSPPGGALRWAPPALNNPETIHLGNGFTELNLDRSRDYVIVMPPFVKVGGTSIDGGHNIVLIGGQTTVPPALLPTADAERQRRGLYFTGATGTVHVEGVQIDGSGGGEADGIALNTPDAIVQLQNVRIVNLHGTEQSVHSDIVQPCGGVKELRIDRMTGSSAYQGLQIGRDLGPIGKVTISRTNLAQTEEGRLDSGNGYVLWLTSGATGCEATPTTLSDVYVQPRSGNQFERTIWPSPINNHPCAARIQSGFADWPSLPAITGGVHAGTPPGGDFVPAGAAGIGYVSPGS
jgi:hypothetical protein